MNVRSLLLSCHSYPDLLRRTAKLSNKEKGDVWETVVRLHLAEEPGVRVWTWSRLPHNIRKHLRVGNRDLGIDLVVEATFDGRPQYRAVQCKLYSAPALGHGDLATFTSSVGAHPGFARAIIASNVKSLTLNFDEAQGDQADKYTRLLDTHWQAKLDGDFWSRLHAALRRKTTKPPRRKPRPHQAAALADVRRALEGGDRAKLIMACGTGKTFTAYLAAQKYRVTAWFVPSLHLEKQVLDEVRAQDHSRGIRVRYLAIGSDPSVASARAKDDLFDIDPRTINADYLGTDQKAIVKALREVKTSRHPTHIALPYHSGPLFARCARKAGLAIDLGIFDEAHRTVGEPDGLFAHLLYDKNISIRKRLFMTATPRIFRSGSDLDLVDMDGPEYGELAHDLPFRKAIKAKLLVDYRIVTLVSSNEEVKRHSFVLSKEIRSDRAFSMDQVAAALGLLRAMKEYGARHVISYHRTIRRSRLFRSLLLGLNEKLRILSDLYVESVDAGTKVADRADIIDRAVANSHSVVTNARCLQEGIDEKRFDGVCFVDPKSSKIDLVQSIGRAIRLPPKGEAKPCGWIIVPTFLEKGIDFHDLAGGPWARLAQVIRHLATVDTAIRDEVVAILNSDVREYLGRGNRFAGNTQVVGKTVKQMEALYRDIFTLLHQSRVDSAGRLTVDDFHAAANRLGPGFKWIGRPTHPWVLEQLAKEREV